MSCQQPHNLLGRVAKNAIRSATSVSLLTVIGMSGALSLGGFSTAGAATSNDTQKAIQKLADDTIANVKPDELQITKSGATCFATKVVKALGPARAVQLGYEPTETGTLKLMTPKERDVYFNAVTTCIADIDKQYATLLLQIRTDLTSKQASCVAVAIRKNGALKESFFSDGSDASNKRIDAGFVAASKTCKITPVISFQ